MIFPIITSLGRVGMESRFSIVPRSRSRVIARPVIMTIVMRQDHAHEAGHDVVLGDDLRVVERVDPHVDRAVGGVERSERALQVLLQRGVSDVA